MKKRDMNQKNRDKDRKEIDKLLDDISKKSMEEVYIKLDSSENGKTEVQTKDSREKYGENIVSHEKEESTIMKIMKPFINPFTIILIVLAIVSIFTDIVFAKPGEEEYMTMIIIFSMVIISGTLEFVQESKSGNTMKKLLEMIKTTTCIERSGLRKQEIPISEVVVGDIVHLSAGDMIPGDIRIINAKDLFVSQSSMTGESEPVEKYQSLREDEMDTAILDRVNLGFMGTNVISGTAKGIVVTTGDRTIFGDISSKMDEKPVETSFEKGVNSVSWLLIRFMLVMVPVVFFINGFTKGNWLEALLFSISIAIGLTPEMLPMIITTTLAKGAVAMSKEKTVIKNLNAIQNFGSINILCTDKTGTLTQDKIVLEYHMNIHGESDSRVLRHAFLNSYYQTGLKNLIDIAIIERTSKEQEQEGQLRNLSTNYNKVDEIPFDFERRRMSVVVEDGTGKTQMITKGAIEEMLEVSNFAEYKGEVLPLTDELKGYILKKVEEFNSNGLRVIGVAQKTNPSPVGEFSVKDEEDMVLMGYLAFLDPPKESTPEAIKALKNLGVDVKILTGDNEKVTQSVCRQVGMEIDHIVLGNEIDNMDDEELKVVSNSANVFAKLSPMQKSRIIKSLRDSENVVGYMGDGINDAPAMKVSDVGISVDTAVDLVKEAADVILLEKDLMVLEKGIIEGRKTYANMIKYIKMTASSNFGNMFSVLVASAFLPFMPMMSLHIILLNLIYDLSCITIPWDNVDKEFLEKPRDWDAGSVGKFMVWIGPTSSVFDILTYIIMYFIICPQMSGGLLFHELTDPQMKANYIALFQAGWFVESMWTQTLVIHMIRTPKIPFIESRVSIPVTFMTTIGIAVLTIIPFTSFGRSIGLIALPGNYFFWLGAIVIAYMVLVTVVKNSYVRKHGELL